HPHQPVVVADRQRPDVEGLHLGGRLLEGRVGADALDGPGHHFTHSHGESPFTGVLFVQLLALLVGSLGDFMRLLAVWTGLAGHSEAAPSYLRPGVPLADLLCVPAEEVGPGPSAQRHPRAWRSRAP